MIERGLCDNCNKETQFRCSQCLSTFYCSRKCQRHCWSIHQIICNNKLNTTNLKENIYQTSSKVITKIEEVNEDNNDDNDSISSTNAVCDRYEYFNPIERNLLKSNECLPCYNTTTNNSSGGFTKQVSFDASSSGYGAGSVSLVNEDALITLVNSLGVNEDGKYLNAYWLNILSLYLY